MSILATEQVWSNLSKVLDLARTGHVKINDVTFTDLSNTSSDVQSQSLIDVVSRVTIDQMLVFTSGHPIQQVVPNIYHISVSIGIDPCFALSEAILETGWGTSYDAKVRHNYYGYEAYYSNPSAAKVFPNPTSGITLALTDIKKEYCTEGGEYYDDGAGATIAGWAKHWINGGTTYISRVATIIENMNSMIHTKP